MMFWVCEQQDATLQERKVADGLSNPANNLLAPNSRISEGYTCFNILTAKYPTS
ncbi:hypothetical protein [Marinagarivorans algicola]|uniref:hypothetical protein n=1 Tax=Marinagarivorans algicola TaxID=1513270 RepID=UPI0012E22277|nr:hypothetical protein [Marinagarivorans algicola]